MRWLLLLLLAVLTGCTPPAGGGGAAPTPPPPSLDGWQVLYRREGWDGGGALDLRAVGDIMLGRRVGKIAAGRGFAYPFAAAAPLLAGDPAPGAVTLALGNLESPLTDREGPLRPGPYRLPAATAFAPALRAAGFGALSLANNHALDAGPAGLQDAAAALAGADVLALGAGPGAAAAREPAIVVAGALRVALFGLNDVGDPEDRPDEGQGEPASSAAWGRAWLDEAALQRIGAARERADMVVVLVHWGREYAPRPTARQREWARRLVGAGADLVLGAHPHVLQPAELLAAEGRTGFVAYSLGNFIFDQADAEETSTGAVLRVLLDRRGVALAAAAPVAISAGQARPLALAAERGRAALARLAGEAAPASAAPDLSAWSWDGSAARPAVIPPGTRLAQRPARLPADLRGDGQPLWASLDAGGMVELRDGAEPAAPLAWRNEGVDWRVTRIDAGDLDHDGRIELLLLLWRPPAAGAAPGSHPFLIGWRGGRFRVTWGGSATAVPMQDVAIGDLDGDGRAELVVLEGGSAPGDPGARVAILTWRGWLFELLWRSPPGSYRGLALQDLDGDGRTEIIVSR